MITQSILLSRLSRKQSNYDASYASAKNQKWLHQQQHWQRSEGGGDGYFETHSSAHNGLEIYGMKILMQFWPAVERQYQ